MCSSAYSCLDKKAHLKRTEVTNPHNTMHNDKCEYLNIDITIEFIWGIIKKLY